MWTSAPRSSWCSPHAARTLPVYGELSYRLILKEAGAVFHAAAMAAAVMELGVCPLGCGDSRLFSGLAGTDPRIETSVGEFMLGTIAQDSGDAR